MPTSTPLIFLAGLLLGVLLTLLLRAVGKKQKKQRSSTVLAPHHHEFQRNIQNAIHDLAQLCKDDPSHTELYLTLGNLYRLHGEPQRSLVIHQNILTDNSISKTMRDRACIELAKDLFDIGVEDKAVEQLKTVSERSPLFLVANEKLVAYYYSKQLYEEAADVTIKILKRRKTWRNRKRVGYYFALQAEAVLKEGDIPTAKRVLRKSLGYDRKCVLALLLKADIALQEKQYDASIDTLKDIMHLKPEYAFLAIPKIEDAYYRKQSFMRLGETIEALAREFPDHPYLNYSLGKYYRKKKMFDEARSALSTALDTDATYLLAHEEVANLNEDEKKMTSTVENYRSLLEEVKASNKYHCTHCSTDHDEMTWFCSDCGRWETITADFHIGTHPTTKELPKRHGTTKRL